MLEWASALHLVAHFPVPNVSSSLDRRLTQIAGQWFLNSGIQEPDGGVARYHHSDTGRNARTSTEITGYTVSALVALYQRHQDPALLEAARRSGRFLTHDAWNPELKAFPFECPDRPGAAQLTYFFDCGIIIRGLLALWRITGDRELLDVATKAGESLATDFAAGTAWHPVLELPAKSPLPYTPQWSRQPGCYQLKSALAWHDLHLATGAEKFARFYASAVEAALTAKDEFLPAETRQKTMDRLHAYCYFLEGLFPVAGRPETRATLSEGILRVSSYLRSIRSEFERSDVYAQLLRVRLWTAMNAGLALNEQEAFEEAAAIERFQIDHPSSPYHGGFWFGRKHGEPLPFVNPVSTAFCTQAYDWWLDYQAGRSITQAII